MVRPETVLRWHRQGWRLYRRWRSGPQLGWPRLTAEIQELIATMASEEPALGHSVSAASFSSSASWSVLARSAASVGVALRDRPARAGEPFLANHAQAIWAADLFLVQTLTFQTLLRHLLYQSWQPPASSLRSTCAVKLSPSVAYRTCPSLPDHPSSAPDPRLMDSPDSSMSARAP